MVDIPSYGSSCYTKTFDSSPIQFLVLGAVKKRALFWYVIYLGLVSWYSPPARPTVSKATVPKAIPPLVTTPPAPCHVQSMEEALLENQDQRWHNWKRRGGGGGKVKRRKWKKAILICCVNVFLNYRFVSPAPSPVDLNLHENTCNVLKTQSCNCSPI